jgi:tripartite-type tricarboxylate transporter receptor subunit TctC
MNREISAALARPETQEKMRSHGVIAKSSTVPEFAAYLKDQNAVWKQALDASGVEPQ